MKQRNMLTVVLMAASSAIWAADGVPVTSHNGACQVTVPANWQVSKMFGSANSPDNKANVSVTSPLHSSSLDDLKQTAKMLYTNDKVTKDSATEFQMEGLSMNNKPNVYRGISIGGGKLCVAEVIYESGAIDDARRIAASLKSAK
jgi:hypothetical protein